MRSQFIRYAAGLALAVAVVGCSTESTGPDMQAGTVAQSEGYIVVFKKNATVTASIQGIENFDTRERAMTEVARNFIATQKIDPNVVYTSWGTAITGFAANLTSEQVSMLQKNADVAFIEKDAKIQLPADEMTPELIDPLQVGRMQAEQTPYGITRVGGGQAYTGANVCWIIDTGIDLDHPDLRVDRARAKNFSSTRQKGNTVGDDGNGHGTHCAGIVAAVSGNGIGVVGVAPGATVVPVKVLSNSGSGTWSSVINGCNYVAGNAQPGDVANMSLGGGASNSVDAAVIGMANANVWVAVAAGNDGANAINSSPARANHAKIFTISAVNSSDVMASWSNWGNPPVDYAEPGVSIYSTYKGGGYATLSGTSMAAPHMAGILIAAHAVGDGGAVTGDKDNMPDPIGVIPD